MSDSSHFKRRKLRDRALKLAINNSVLINQELFHTLFYLNYATSVVYQAKCLFGV